MSRMNVLKAVATVAICGFLLNACTTEKLAPPPAIDFLSGPKVRIDVANVSVVLRYHSPSARPNIEQKHPVTPVTLARQWTMERLATTGSSGEATLTILDGSVIEQQLPGKSGIEGVIGDYPVAKYVARLQARLTVVKPGNVTGALSTYNANVNVWAERSILKNDDPIVCDREYDVLMKTIASRFDQSLTAEIQRSMRPVVRP